MIEIFKESHFAEESTEYFKFWVCCPVCGSEHTHITGTDMVGDHDNNPSGTPHRGFVTNVYFECENGRHKWALCFGFHKGNTFSFISGVRQQERTIE